MTVTDATETDLGEPSAESENHFHSVPPLMGPLMEWKPEYGTVDDEGTTHDLGGGAYVYTSPNFTFAVNTLYVATPDGAAVMDSQLLPRHAEQIVADIAERTGEPIRYVTNSHHHPDHIWGNATFVEAGAELVSSHLTARLIDRSAAGDQLFFLGVYGEHFPEAFVVPRTTFVRSRELWLGTTAIQLFEFSDSSTAAGESLDMTFAWLPQSRILHVGDALEPESHTFFADGTSVPDWLVQLHSLRDLVKELGPKVIVPGHGAPGDASLIDTQENYLRTVASMVEDHCSGGDAPLDDDTKAALKADILEAFPGYGNPMLLDLSLDMMQMTGPIAFLNGRPGGGAPLRLPSFR